MLVPTKTTVTAVVALRGKLSPGTELLVEVHFIL